MSDNQLDPEQQKAYREGLEEQAKLLGVEFRSTISDEKLAARIKAVKEGSPVEADTDDDIKSETPTKAINPLDVKLIPQSEMKFNKAITAAEKRSQAKQMQRVIVTCNDPAKKEWQGEILEVGNSVIGEIKKYIPFGTAWYVPNALLKMMKSKMYQRFYTRKDKFGNETRYGKNEPAYNISFIGNLDEADLQALAKKQMARGEAD